MRQTFPSADEVTTFSGKKAVIFNIKRNDYRLVTAVHYERSFGDQYGNEKIAEGHVYLFYFLTHSEYDKDLWKGRL